MKKLFFMLAFMLVGTFAFGITSKTNENKLETKNYDKLSIYESPNLVASNLLIIKTINNNNSTVVSYYDEVGCMHYVVVYGTDGRVLNSFKFYDDQCDSDMAFTGIQMR